MGRCAAFGGGRRYLSGIVNDGKVGLLAGLSGLEELGMGALFARQLVHKGAVRRPGKPAFLIQQSQDTRGVGLGGEGGKPLNPP